ncbi:MULTISPECIES: hypothetical protein [unclassified Streptomyces]|uniref:hypothetical protein n=1 Tax=unclassified Streptomyces TaxID=2593676 RepID=UPI003D91BAC9
MSVSRNVVRLFATCVASGALVGVAALPALADDGCHDRDLGSNYSDSYRHDDGYLYQADWNRDRGWDMGYGRDWDNSRKHHNKHHNKHHRKHHNKHHNNDWNDWNGSYGW